jgi:hypothetical protein
MQAVLMGLVDNAMKIKEKEKADRDKAAGVALVQSSGDRAAATKQPRINPWLTQQPPRRARRRSPWPSWRQPRQLPPRLLSARQQAPRLLSTRPPRRLPAP